MKVRPSTNGSIWFIFKNWSSRLPPKSLFRRIVHPFYGRQLLLLSLPSSDGRRCGVTCAFPPLPCRPSIGLRFRVRRYLSSSLRCPSVEVTKPFLPVRESIKKEARTAVDRLPMQVPLPIRSCVAFQSRCSGSGICHRNGSTVSSLVGQANQSNKEAADNRQSSTQYSSRSLPSELQSIQPSCVSTAWRGRRKELFNKEEERRPTQKTCPFQPGCRPAGVWDPSILAGDIIKEGQRFPFQAGRNC